MSKIVVFLVFLSAQAVCSASIKCTGFFSEPSVASIANQLGLSQTLASRFKDNPEVNKAARLIVEDESLDARLGSMSYGVITSNEPGEAPEILVLFVASDGVKTGSMKSQSSLDIAKFTIALSQAIQILFDQGAQEVRLNFSTFINQTLFSHVKERLKNNSSMQTSGDVDHDSVYISILRPSEDS